MSVFIPSSEFDLSSGKSDLKIDADLIYKEGGLIQHMKYYDFGSTNNINSGHFTIILHFKNQRAALFKTRRLFKILTSIKIFQALKRKNHLQFLHFHHCRFHALHFHQPMLHIFF